MAAAEQQERAKRVERTADDLDQHALVESEILLPPPHFVSKVGVDLRVARGVGRLSVSRDIGKGRFGSGLGIRKGAGFQRPAETNRATSSRA